MMPLNEQGDTLCGDFFKKSKKCQPMDLDLIHSSHAPYLGSVFFASPSYNSLSASKSESPMLDNESDSLTTSTVSSEDDDMFFSENDVPQRQRSGIIENVTNTLPSFRKGCPLHLRISESFKGSQSDNFSYDPDLSSGEYIIQTNAGNPYGGGLYVKLGAQFSWLGDQWGRALAATWSRQTDCPSHIIYSAKPFFVGQQHSSHRSVSPPSDRDDSDFRLYPWALLKKEGPSLEHDVCLYMVDEDLSKERSQCNRNSKSRNDFIAESSCGSFFCTKPSFRSSNSFCDGIHSQTIVSRINTTSQTRSNANHSSTLVNKKGKEDTSNSVPCSFIRRDPFIFDAIDVTIAPGIDPLLIICCLAVHTRMDMEIMLAQTQALARKVSRSNR